MKLGYIGLGKMGGNMVQRLLNGGHEVVAHDRDAKAIAAVVEKGAVGASSLDDVVQKLKPARAVWVMVPAGEATEQVVMELAQRITVLHYGEILAEGPPAEIQENPRVLEVYLKT